MDPSDIPETRKPRHRSALRLRLGALYYSLRRYLFWLIHAGSFAHARDREPLPHLHFVHATPLLRKLRDVDMVYQYHKITNLRLACARLDGLLLRPGETFSYWRTIGRPSPRKGYLDGIVLVGGTVSHGPGGGLCQLSNLVYWMTLHTPLTVAERHRHGYDVFPDSNRTLPFGSGATCYYPYGDLMVRNDTNLTFQLRVRVGTKNLEGEWRADAPPEYRYEIVEKNHEMRGEYWGGFSRHNVLWRRIRDASGALVAEEYVTENHALMMYAPFIDGHTEKDDVVRSGPDTSAGDGRPQHLS